MTERAGPGPLRALLGPTNTGKTHRAVLRMLEHESGMIGLPLRLLAREVYDRITGQLGEQAVALVTGEEKRIPPRPRYWVCTVEAMPQDREVDFLAVDEIQLAAHPERGHIFTDRLLNARGREETWFMGSDTMKPLMESLLPTLRTETHPRLSQLKSAGACSLRALRPRSAVVAFSATQVYEVAERLRQLRGGAAVVMGALSPRTRNAQVALYQSGEVDYLVATDAIGMGLNMDVEHVAFAATSKFDGKETRPLDAAELAQIAGRAGRYLNDGSFGTLAPHPALPLPLAQAIELHHFSPHRFIWWRNSNLDTATIPRLIESLRERSRRAQLKPIERSQDVDALLYLAGMDEIRRRAQCPEEVELLWEVCQIPDFGDVTLQHHSLLLSTVFRQLSDRGALDPEWLETSIRRIDDPDGDIDTLMMRIELTRTLTYITHRPRWLIEAEEWQTRTQQIEERLSDALHLRLMERFVEPGRSSGPRARKRARSLPRVEEEGPKGEFGGAFGQLLALKLKLSPNALPDARDLTPDGWAHDLVEAPHEAFALDEEAQLWAGDRLLGRLTRGADRLHPEVKLALDDQVGAGARARLQRRLVAWSRDCVAQLFAELRSDAARAFSSSARGLAYQLEQGLGTITAKSARTQVQALSPKDRELCRALGIVLGHHHVFLTSGLEPEAVIHKMALMHAWEDNSPFLEDLDFREGAGQAPEKAPLNQYLDLGFPIIGGLAVRVDHLEAVSQKLHHAARPGEFDLPPAVSSILGTEGAALFKFVEGLGYRRTPEGRWAKKSGGGPARGRKKRKPRGDGKATA